MPYIALEGGIGAGKSTLLEPLAAELGMEVVHEGIETDKGFQDKLKAFYETNSKEDFDALQFYLADYRTSLIQKMNKDKWYIMERSLQGAALFCIAENHTDTATAMLQDYKHVETPAHYLYLECPPEVCQERIHHRGRDCEMGIPLDYLQRVHKAHSDWGHMAEWAGQATTVSTLKPVHVPTLAGVLKTYLKTKGYNYV